MNYLIPTDDNFIESVAQSMARDFLNRTASRLQSEVIGHKIDIQEQFPDQFEASFQSLWSGNSPADRERKEEFRQHARSAIRAINLNLIIKD